MRSLKDDFGLPAGYLLQVGVQFKLGRVAFTVTETVDEFGIIKKSRKLIPKERHKYYE